MPLPSPSQRTSNATAKHRSGPLSQPGPAYLIGIGGWGMAGLARLLHARGGRVTGTDAVGSDTTRALTEAGVEVHTGQPPAVIPGQPGVVVASAAIKPDHPLMLDALERGIPTLTYAEALGEAMAASTGVAVAGTHGKSTTTAMLAATATEAGLDPTVIVGAACPGLPDPAGGPSGVRIGAAATPTGVFNGRAGLLLAEACEFNRSFHHLRPRVACITAIEADHLDIYGSLDAVIEAFHGFASLLPEDAEDPAEAGRLLIGHDNAHRREVARGLRCRVETIGFNPAADWHVQFDPQAARVRIVHRGRAVAEFRSPMPGEHSAMNAATAFVLADWLGAERTVAVRALAGFPGVHRRLERLGDRPLPGGGAVTVYDDYGHHPTEVELTLRAIRAHERVDQQGRRLICVFQPHQHSRTRFLLDEFASAFEHADVVIVPNIYFVRDSEAEKHRVSARDLVDRLRDRGKRAMHLYPFDAIVEQLETGSRPGDVVVVMGAGPVWQVAHAFLETPAITARPEAVG
ncbi:MAG: UDP-N-acetylmuramate--L-alanine ligase [Planctomycetota bacterium]